MARTNRPNMKHAVRMDIFTIQCCCGCGIESAKFYVVNEGMYAGFRYCRSCAQQHLIELREEE